MSDPQTFLAFGAVMVVIALLAVAVDWFGKPLRHRKFVPKIYRFPEERQPRGSSVRRTEWSDRALVLPVVDLDPVASSSFAEPSLGGGVSVFDQESPAFDTGSTASVSVFSPGDGPATAAVETIDPSDSVPDGTMSPARAVPFVDRRERGWEPGGFVFNLTDDGDEPTHAMVRERYWRNVAATVGASMFGADNVERMSVGRPPRRRNPRTGKFESMTLPAATHHDLGGRTPVPSWPGDELDPFAS